MKGFFKETSRPEQGTSTRNEDTELPRWLSDIVARFKQSYLTLSIDDLGQLNLSESLKAFLIEVIMCADKVKYPTSNSQLLQEIKELGIKQIEEIRKVVDVRLRSQDEKTGNTYIQTQIVIPLPPTDIFDGEFGLPPPFEDFTGRQDELKLLGTGLGGEQVITQKIAGTGGIGKSQLANCFVREQLKLKHFKWVIWLRGAENEETTKSQIASQFVTLANQLGIDVKQAQASGALYKMLYQKLSQKGKGLVVMDDVPSYTAIQSFLPKTLGQTGMSVLLTTRNSRNFGPHIPSILLSVFTLPDAATYIGKILGSEVSDAAKIKLADTLGRYPLALTQALAYITSDEAMHQAPEEAIFKYCENYTQIRQDQEAFLKQTVFETDHYLVEREVGNKEQEATIWAVVQLSKRRIKERLSSIPDAYRHVCQVLNAASHLAPEAGIAKDLLRGWAPEIINEATFKQSVLAPLESVSLLTQTKSGDYTIHQVVQDVLKLDQKTEEAHHILLKWAKIIWDYKTPDIENTPVHEKQTLALETHALALAQELSQQKRTDETLAAESEMHTTSGMASDLKGDNSKAKSCFENALRCERQKSTKSVKEAYCLINLANAFLASGDPQRAKLELENALEIFKSTLAGDDLSLGRCIMSLGKATMSCGDLSSAIKHFEAALIILRTYLGEEHIDVLICLMNLGEALLQSGNPHGGKKLFEEALPILKRTLGDQHTKVGSCLMNLGMAVRSIEDPHKAINYFDKALCILRVNLGEQNATVGICLANLGSTLLSCGDIQRAIKNSEAALAILRTAFGNHHEYVAKIQMELGLQLLQNQDSLNAQKHFKEALPFIKNTYGLQHEHVGRGLLCLGMAERSNGNSREGSEHLEEALPILRATLGERDVDVGRCLANLGYESWSSGKELVAMKYLEEALPILQETHDKQHIDVGRCSATLGMAIYSCDGDLQRVRKLLETGHSILQSNLGEHHGEVGHCLGSIGIAQIDCGDQQNGIKNLQKSIRILKEFYGENHSLTKYYLAALNLTISRRNPQNVQAPEMTLKRWKTQDPAQAIRRATVNGSPEDLNALLKFYPEQANQPDQTPNQGLTALHLAVTKKKVEHVGILLSCIGFNTTPDAKGFSALDYALHEDNTEILHHFRDALLKKYSQLKITPTQLPKLVRACAQNGDASGLKLLMHLKVPCDEAGPTTGQTALHLAVGKAHLECVKLLMAAKADPHKKDRDGGTPLSLSENSPDIRRELIVNEEPKTSATTPTLH